ncbi:MAG: AAA family ATPase [Geminicoccaceae bacterium]
MNVGAWLRGLGLGQYEQAFRDNDIEAGLLPTLTMDDLRELGVASLGHRKQLLAAIAALAPRGEPRPSLSPNSSPASMGLQAERRQLTVMFCDLVGSTALSSGLDPEDMRELIRAYQNAVTGEIARFEGHVAKFMGDGVLAYFGWPRAQEDAAERAVRAGLEMAGSVAELRTPAGDALAARIGIATGLVIVGDLIGEGGAREEAIVGDTPNLAARLQALASPGQVVIAEGTRRLVGRLFALRDLGLRELKGFAAPVPAYVVRGEARVHSRYEALKGGRVVPLVGRERELGLLLHGWEAARAGRGRAVLVSGEAGIGKSRLAQALVKRAKADGAVTLGFSCSPYHAATALFPVVDHLQRAAGLESEDAGLTKLAKLEALIAPAAEEPGQVVPLFASLLGITTDGSYRVPELTPAALKARTFEVLLGHLAGLARGGPVLALFEDLHWADPTTLELLVAVASAVPEIPVLLVATARSEFQPPWPGDGCAETVPLSRLGPRQSASLLRRLAGAKRLPAALEADILAKTDGVPLFLEELTGAVLEAGWLADAGDRYELAQPLPALEVPATLQGSLMARLDRLAGPPRAVAQAGAVIGREFTHALLAPLADLPRLELDAALGALEEGGLVVRRGEPPEAVYSFKHALVRDAAYESLLKSRRRVLHGRLVAAVERELPRLAADQPELLARHCAGGELSEKAAAYWRKAGEQAVRRAANREAIEHFRRALELTATQPETAERDRTELAILSQLGPALMSVHGWPVPEVGEAFERAERVARRLEGSADLTSPLVGSWLFHVARGQFARAEEISGELFRIADELDDPEVLLQAHHAAWPTRWLRGLFAGAEEHIGAGMSLYDEGRHHRHRYLYLGHDPAVCALAIGAPVLWLLGHPERAARREREAIGLARRLGHAPSLAHALWFVGEGQVARGDVEAAMATARELLALCDEHRLPQPRATALMFQGWVLARCGDVAEGSRQLEEGLAVWDRLGARSYLPRGLCLLAEARLLEGRHAEGLEQVTRALAVADETGEHWCTARMHRLRAELLLHLRGRNDEAVEMSLRAAVDVARSQGATAWELQAATFLARLVAERGERTEARDLLAPVHARFSEGLDTPDLREAKELLETLG